MFGHKALCISHVNNSSKICFFGFIIPTQSLPKRLESYLILQKTKRYSSSQRWKHTKFERRIWINYKRKVLQRLADRYVWCMPTTFWCYFTSGDIQQCSYICAALYTNILKSLSCLSLCRLDDLLDTVSGIKSVLKPSKLPIYVANSKLSCIANWQNTEIYWKIGSTLRDCIPPCN